MSMNPGVTAQPDASSSCLPWRLGPISVMTPSAMATSARRPGSPLPSKTVPPRMTRSVEMWESAAIEVQPRAVGRGDHSPVGLGEGAERLLDGLTRVRERAVGVRVVRRPHARFGADEGYHLGCQRVVLERGHDLAADQLAGRGGGRVLEVSVDG